MAKPLTLEKMLHVQGFGARKLCRILIHQGEVRVNGQVCDDPDAVFDLQDLHFTVAGADWQYREKSYLMLNKPANYECSHKPQHHPSVYSLLPHPLVAREVQCIGRLDEDTTGLILLSDDGQFIHRMSSPKWKVPKVYAVTTKHVVDDHQIDALLQGVKLLDEEETIAALACERIAERLIHLTLGEGKYHQVKRMLAAVSNRVEALHRIRIGRLELPDDLKLGEWRWLDANMLAQLAPADKPAV